MVQHAASLADARRIVIKLGTQIVVDPTQNGAGGELSRQRLEQIAQTCAQLMQSGRQTLVVSSGAVGLGRGVLGKAGELTLSEKQACAAVGQGILMEAWRGLFADYGIPTAQVLVTAMDFAHRRHYLNLRQTLETLLSWSVVPVINENDSVSTMELRDEGYDTHIFTKGFGDNDKLSALIASKLDADLLIILTNVDGVYTDNPHHCETAERIPLIQNFQDLRAVQTQGKSTMGRGGMSSKLEAARIAAISGVKTWITSGMAPDPLHDLLDAKPASDGPKRGTLVLPQASISGKKRWIGASGYHGVIVVNENARHALVNHHASLLPIGIVAVSGGFLANQTVSIQTEDGLEIGRGVSHYASQDIERIKGLSSEQAQGLLASREHSRHEVIHRDNLVIFEEYGV